MRAVVVCIEALGANTMPQVNPLARELVFKVVYYGPGLGGKTTSLQHVYAATRPEHRGKMVSLATPVDRTLYFDFLPIRLPASRDMTVRLQLFTVPGQVYYNATRKLVLTGADGVVFVADSQLGREDSNLESFRNLEENLAEHGRGLDEMPHVFAYNKRDMPEVTPIDEMERLLNARGAPSFATVATTGDGVFEALEAITRAVLEDFEMRVPEHRGLAPSALAMPEGGLAEALRLMDGVQEAWDTPASSTHVASDIDPESGMNLPAEDDVGEEAARLIVEPMTKPGIGLSSMAPSRDDVAESRWRPLPVPLNGVGMRSSPPSSHLLPESEEREREKPPAYASRFESTEPLERKSLASRLAEREQAERDMVAFAPPSDSLSDSSRESTTSSLEERELALRQLVEQRFSQRAFAEQGTAVSEAPRFSLRDVPSSKLMPPDTVSDTLSFSGYSRSEPNLGKSGLPAKETTAEAAVLGIAAPGVQATPQESRPSMDAVLPPAKANRCSLSILWPDDEVETVERVELAIADNETRDAVLLCEVLTERCIEDLANRLGKYGVDTSVWVTLLGLRGESYVDFLRLLGRAKATKATISRNEALSALLFATNLCVAKRQATGQIHG